MPGYKGHLVGGGVAFGLLFFGLVGTVIAQPSLLTAGEWLLFALAGSLFPDIDIKSKGQKYFYYVIFLFFIILAAQQRFEMLTCFSFVIITPMLARHRGIFHNQWFVIAVPLILWIMVSMAMPRVSNQFFFDILFFITGALSHIWLDFGARQMIRRSLTRKKTRW
ncbi:MAG TPA: metal-dependent hydrolase [Candidatus Babeliales bacterium]|jgi:hypothetical protein|nr:metal-dependent hydrolase [Candidatus Babeliales bacterium]